MFTGAPGLSSIVYTALTHCVYCSNTVCTVFECVYLCLCGLGLAVSQLVLSSRTVWVRCVNGDLARRYGLSERNPAGDYWKKIPGNANWLTGKTVFIHTGDRTGVTD